ncbi:hypothetical protein ACSQ67_003387 [Phaseolus vulgaris]
MRTTIGQKIDFIQDVRINDTIYHVVIREEVNQESPCLCRCGNVNSIVSNSLSIRDPMEELSLQSECYERMGRVEVNEKPKSEDATVISPENTRWTIVGSACVNEVSFPRRNLLSPKKISENPSLPIWHQTFVEDTYIDPTSPNLRYYSFLTPYRSAQSNNASHPTFFDPFGPLAPSLPRLSRTQPIASSISICALGSNRATPPSPNA